MSILHGLESSVVVQDIKIVDPLRVDLARAVSVNVPDIMLASGPITITVNGVLLMAKPPPFAGLTKGDAIKWRFPLVFDDGSDLTGYKIRADLRDTSGNTIKLATENAGGTSDDVDIDGSTFTVNVPSGSTADFDDIASLEVEMEDGDGNIHTILNAEKVRLKDQVITPAWAP